MSIRWLTHNQLKAKCVYKSSVPKELGESAQLYGPILVKHAFDVLFQQMTTSRVS
jgi:hypothetical protein